MLDIVRSFTRTDVRVISGSTFVVGAAAGYFAAKKHVTKKLDLRTQEDIEAIRDMYARRYKEGEYADLETDHAVLFTENNEGLEISPVIEKTDYETRVEGLGYSNDEERGTTTILAHNVVVVDHVERRNPSVSERDPERPYVITREAFEDPEVGNQEQVTFSWWEGDKTLSDEQEKIVSDVEGSVGRANLDRFGDGSDDPNVVYIRNERLGLDYEVIRDPGLYSIEVAGDIPAENFERNRRPGRLSDDG